MLITNWNLLESIEASIMDYNNQLWREDDKHLRLDGLEYAEDWESAEVPVETLRKLKTLRISLIVKNTNDEELIDITNQLSKLLDNMKLILFSFSMNSKGNQASKVDLSFLEHLNEDVKIFSLTGVDLSKEHSELFSRFQNLHHCNLQKCNISNPTIISDIPQDTFISLERNKIDPLYYSHAIELIKKKNGRVVFSDENLQTITRNLFRKVCKFK